MKRISTDQIKGLKSGVKFALAGLLAFLFYLWFDLQFGYWTVVTVAAVMRPNIEMTTSKCLLRLFGTLIGVVISYVSILILKHFPYLLYPIFFCGMFLSGLLIFTKRNYSYMGVICGITIIIIVTTFNTEPAYFYSVTVDRTLDVIMGILIGWVCSVWVFPVKNSNQTTPSAVKWTEHRIPFKLALTMAIATTVSLIPWFSLHYSGGFWAPIACLIIIEETIEITQKKSIERFIAHVIVLFLTAMLSFLLNNAFGIGLALIIGLFLFGYWMENPLVNFGSSMANSMAIAFCIVLLYSPGVNTIHVALMRFFNTTLGIAIGMIVVNFIHRFDKQIPSFKKQ